ncbi:hypothetical protein ARMSODRAFT_981665 [Armillaria solidipes]|uniref:Uncharacterized protein n=1 Tax=Armillaria solidipes TaxID=1076256 RepID=A0A2H3B5N9_9AGAR|nr:hypothetical protein ARMSODRAFT_981665 [Armillaria solidipes]
MAILKDQAKWIALATLFESQLPSEDDVSSWLLISAGQFNRAGARTFAIDSLRSTYALSQPLFALLSHLQIPLRDSPSSDIHPLPAFYETQHGGVEKIHEVDVNFIRHAGPERFDEDDAGLGVDEDATEETSVRDQCVATSSDAQPVVFDTMPKPYAEVVNLIFAVNSMRSLESTSGIRLSLPEVWTSEDWYHFRNIFRCWRMDVFVFRSTLVGLRLQISHHILQERHLQSDSLPPRFILHWPPFALVPEEHLGGLSPIPIHHVRLVEFLHDPANRQAIYWKTPGHLKIPVDSFSIFRSLWTPIIETNSEDVPQTVDL